MRTYEDHLWGRGFAERTIRARLTLYRSREAAWGTWDQPTHVVAAWLNQYDGWSRRTYHSHLGSIYGYLLEQGIVDRNPLACLRRPPTPRPCPRPLSESQLKQAVLAADERTTAFLMLGYLAGLRAHEIAKMHGRDVDEHRVVVLGKGGSIDAVPTHPVLWDLARIYPRDGFWFPPQTRRINPHVQADAVTRSVRDLFRSLGIDGASHRARHTYGTRLLREGANLRVVQDLMRHRSLATTALYLGVDEDERVAAIRSLAA